MVTITAISSDTTSSGTTTSDTKTIISGMAMKIKRGVSIGSSGTATTSIGICPMSDNGRPTGTGVISIQMRCFR